MSPVGYIRSPARVSLSAFIMSGDTGVPHSVGKLKNLHPSLSVRACLFSWPFAARNKHIRRILLGIWTGNYITYAHSFTAWGQYMCSTNPFVPYFLFACLYIWAPCNNKGMVLSVSPVLIYWTRGRNDQNGKHKRQAWTNENTIRSALV